MATPGTEQEDYSLVAAPSSSRRLHDEIDIKTDTIPELGTQVISCSDTSSKVSHKVSIRKVLSDDFNVGKLMVGSPARCQICTASEIFSIKFFYKNINVPKTFDHISLSLKQDDFLIYFFISVTCPFFITQNTVPYSFITYRYIYVTWYGTDVF